jgi:uncharacterized protein (UPF0335 family)
MISRKLDEFVSRQGIISAEFCKLIDTVEKMETENKILKDCVEYYASVEPDNLFTHSMIQIISLKARRALEKIK